ERLTTRAAARELRAETHQRAAADGRVHPLTAAEVRAAVDRLACAAGQPRRRESADRDTRQFQHQPVTERSREALRQIRRGCGRVDDARGPLYGSGAGGNDAGEG